MTKQGLLQFIHEQAVRADMRQHYDVRVEQAEMEEEEHIEQHAPVNQHVENEPADMPEAKRQRVQ